MLVLSLFPGIGLLDMAFEQEGFCVVRGPDVLWGGDIRRFHPPAGKFDGVIGGPPCQEFSSLARLVKATGRKPKFGNLIPEFERCVKEASPSWFLMENVIAAPVPSVVGYSRKSFLIDNSHLLGEAGFGLEQRRLRRFSFATRGHAQPPSLLRWIDLCVFTLPDGTGTITQWTPNNSPERKRRHEPLTGGGDRPPSYRRKPVTSNVGGPGRRMPPVCAMQGSESQRPGSDRVYARRYRLPDAMRLQGLPAGFLDYCPFTAEAKLKAVANGVPLPMGRAIAKAVKEAIMSG